MKAPPKRVFVGWFKTWCFETDERRTAPKYGEPRDGWREYRIVPKRPAKRKRVKR